LPFALPDARHFPRFHDRLLPDDDEQAPADAQRALKALVIERQRARDRDDIVGRLPIELHAVPELDADIVDRDGQQVRARAIYELGKDLDASHAAGELAQTSCEITRAGADQ